MDSKFFKTIWKIQPFLVGLCAVLAVVMLGGVVWNLAHERWGWAAIDLFLAIWNGWAVRLNIKSRNRIKKYR